MTTHVPCHVEHARNNHGDGLDGCRVQLTGCNGCYRLRHVCCKGVGVDCTSGQIGIDHKSICQRLQATTRNRQRHSPSSFTFLALFSRCVSKRTVALAASLNVRQISPRVLVEGHGRNGHVVGSCELAQQQ